MEERGGPSSLLRSSGENTAVRFLTSVEDPGGWTSGGGGVAEMKRGGGAGEVGGGQYRLQYRAGERGDRSTLRWLNSGSSFVRRTERR